MANNSLDDAFIFGAPILSLDQGTSSSRALLYGRGERPRTAQRALGFDAPRAGWVEQDGEEIWGTIVESAKALLSESEENIAAIGLTNQRETTLLWERETGRVIAPAIVWQDKRTEDFCETLRTEGTEEMIKAKTGLVLDSYFSATKLRWLLENIDGARAAAERGALAFGTVESFLIYRLTGGRVHASDATNAARTMLYNIHEHRWDEDLLKLFEIPAPLLPELRDNADDFGETNLFGGAIPIRGAVGDQQGAAIGQNCIREGLAKSTYGTGCFLLSHRGSKVPQAPPGLLATTAFRLEGKSAYALEGSIFMAGAIVQWLRDSLGFIASSKEVESLAREASEESQTYLVPAFTGLGAPYWDGEARGALYGMTRSTGKAEIARAALESVAYQSCDLLDAMGAEERPDILRVDGGMAVNDFLMQFLADISGAAVERPEDIETTARGAAILAALGAGLYGTLEEACGGWRAAKRFTPSMDAQTRASKLSGWQEVVRRTLTKSIPLSPPS